LSRTAAYGARRSGLPPLGAGGLHRLRLTGWRAFGNSSFRRLWLAGALSSLGSQLGRMGLILYLFERRGSAADLAILVVAETLPGTLAAPLAGMLVDRLGKRGILVGADLARFLSLPAVLVWPTPGVIYATAALHSVAAAFFQPARSAAVALVVPCEELPAANGADQAAANLMLVGGPVLGAELLLGAGLPATITADALSFLVSALLLWRLEVRAPRSLDGEAPAAAGSALAATRAGWRYAAQHPLVPTLTFLLFVSLLCAGLWTPLAPFFLRGISGGSERLFGLQIGVTGAGAILGTVAAPRLVDRYGRGRTLLAALLAEGLIMTAYSQVLSELGSTLLMLLWGFAVSAILVPFYSLLQTVVEERFLGRVFALVRQGESLALVGAMGLAIALQGHLPIRVIFFAGGLFYFGLTAVVSATLGGRSLRATR
jgi:MFS family permease